jgi:hypothetical protein
VPNAKEASIVNENLSCFTEVAKKELVTMNFFILTGLNLTFDSLSQFLFGIFVTVLFTSKLSSIKDIVIGSKEDFVKILSVDNDFFVPAITSEYTIIEALSSKKISSFLSFSEIRLLNDQQNTIKEPQSTSPNSL